MMVLLLVAAVVALAAGSNSNTEPKPKPSKPSKLWPERRAVLRPYQDALELALDWPGLADFLEVVAYQESKGSLTAVGDGGLAVGPYQQHPSNSAVAELAALGFRDRTDPAIATAAAALHASNLLRKASYGYPAEDARWTDVRAGWAIPSWVGDRTAKPQQGKDRPGVVLRHERAAQNLGLPGEPNALARPSQWVTAGQVVSAILNASSG
jgi:hypothetical protein